MELTHLKLALRIFQEKDITCVNINKRLITQIYEVTN